MSTLESIFKMLYQELLQNFNNFLLPTWEKIQSILQDSVCLCLSPLAVKFFLCNLLRFISCRWFLFVTIFKTCHIHASALSTSLILLLPKTLLYLDNENCFNFFNPIANSTSLLIHLIVAKLPIINKTHMVPTVIKRFLRETEKKSSK